MAIHLKSTDTLGSSYPQLINNAATDAISLIPGLYDQWWVHAGLTSGLDAASTAAWTGLTNGKQLIGRTGVNERPMDYISSLAAANNKDVLRTGWDDDPVTAIWDGNNERTQMITTENIFDGSSSYCVYITYIAPTDLLFSRRVWGNDVADDAQLYLLDTDGRLRFYHDGATLLLQDTTKDYRDDTPHVIGVGWDATDQVVTMRVNGVQTDTASSVAIGPEAGKFVLSGYSSTLGQATEGYFRSLAIVQGASLMRSKSLTNYNGDEDTALEAIERGMMEDVGLTYP